MKLAQRLLVWYKSEGRSLPWREEISPYKVWLSEIIMQQTRVAQGLPYFEKFYEALPTIRDFANAEQDQILHLWQGLGYYSRARNMHFAAKQVMNDYNGHFPSTFSELKKLKGVGDYTAAAISSIAFGQNKAVVDGNVYRVLSRLFNIDKPIDSLEGKKYFQKLADELIDPNNPGDYNQAIMDFGAMVCTPKKPLCGDCPFQSICLAFDHGSVQDLPVKTKKVKVRDRYFDYFEIRVGNQIAIEQRNGKGIWNGLYQLPLVEVQSKSLQDVKNIRNITNLTPISIEQIDEKKHVLSHQRLHANFYRVLLSDMGELANEYEWVDKDDLAKFAFPKLISNYLLY